MSTTAERKTTSFGAGAIDAVKHFVDAGMVRSITIRDHDGRELFRTPLGVGLVGFVLIPMWAAIGAIVAVATGCTIEVEMREGKKPLTVRKS
ncbi:MAG: DUF4342 domain-containing protein [Candidatus Dormibacteria bacterium]